MGIFPHECSFCHRTGWKMKPFRTKIKGRRKWKCKTETRCLSKVRKVA